MRNTPRDASSSAISPTATVGATPAISAPPRHNSAADSPSSRLASAVETDAVTRRVELLRTESTAADRISLLALVDDGARRYSMQFALEPRDERWLVTHVGA